MTFLVKGSPICFCSSVWLVLYLPDPADALGEDVDAISGMDESIWAKALFLIPCFSTCLPILLYLFVSLSVCIFHKIQYTLDKYGGIPLFDRNQACSRGFCRTLGRYTFRQVYI